LSNSASPFSGLFTCVEIGHIFMVTTPPNALIARITDRMPAILPREAWTAWLGETDASLLDVKALLRTFEDGGN
jgi:putative SOS response-associated peptidase YedK